MPSGPRWAIAEVRLSIAEASTGLSSKRRIPAMPLMLRPEAAFDQGGRVRARARAHVRLIPGAFPEIPPRHGPDPSPRFDERQAAGWARGPSHAACDTSTATGGGMSRSRSRGAPRFPRSWRAARHARCRCTLPCGAASIWPARFVAGWRCNRVMRGMPAIVASPSRRAPAMCVLPQRVLASLQMSCWFASIAQGLLTSPAS